MGRTKMQNWHGDKLGNITLLQVAVIYNRASLIPFLLSVCYDNPSTASIHESKRYAKQHKHYECVKLLNYPDITINEFRSCPEKNIKKYPFMEKVATLWDNSSDWAASDLDHIKWLYKQGIKTTKQNLLHLQSGDYVCIPGIYAISWGARADVVEWICVATGLEYIADYRTPCHGYNSLHLCVLNNHYHLVPYLLTIMPNARHIRSKRDGKFGRGIGLSPLEYARRLKYHKCASSMAKLDKKKGKKKARAARKMISDLCDDLHWRKTTVKHCKALLRKDPDALKRKGGPLRSLPIFYAIRFKAALPVVHFICSEMGEDIVVSWRGKRRLDTSSFCCL